MKNYNNIKVIIISLVFVLFSVGAKAQSGYITQNKNLATTLSKQYGIPTSVILAIAFVESGGGTSRNSKVFNNHFGIVGKNTVTNSRYKSFTSVTESYEAFCNLLSRKNFYSNLKGNLNPSNWVAALSKTGYSTSPEEWKKRIFSVIEKYGLKELDR